MLRALVAILGAIAMTTACADPNFEPRPNKPPGPPDPGVRAQDQAPSPVFIPLSEKGKATGKPKTDVPVEETEDEEAED